MPIPLKSIPETPNAAVLRTDFSDQPAWQALCAALQKPVGIFRFRANLSFISDPAFAGIPAEQLLSLVPKDYSHSFLFIADRTALTHPERPVLVMDLSAEPGSSFRVIPAEAWGIENNLSIANMDFAEFADRAGPDGIFRGFPRD